MLSGATSYNTGYSAGQTNKSENINAAQSGVLYNITSSSNTFTVSLGAGVYVITLIGVSTGNGSSAGMASPSPSLTLASGSATITTLGTTQTGGISGAAYANCNAALVNYRVKVTSTATFSAYCGGVGNGGGDMNNPCNMVSVVQVS